MDDREREREKRERDISKDLVYYKLSQFLNFIKLTLRFIMC